MKHWIDAAMIPLISWGGAALCWTLQRRSFYTHTVPSALRVAIAT